jgi:hypothetical protein
MSMAESPSAKMLTASRAWWLMRVIPLLEGKVLEAHGGTWGSYPRGLKHPATLGTGHATLKPVTEAAAALK